MKSRKTNHEKWSLQLSRGHKPNRTGHLIRQSVWERATGTDKTPRCMIQEPEWPINPSQGGPVRLGITFFAQPSEPIARCFCRALGHCTLRAQSYGTAGMATLPNPLGRDRVCGFGVPRLSSSFTQKNALLVFYRNISNQLVPHAKEI